jgi:hypothetical protein
MFFYERRVVNKSGKTYIWTDKRDISWETDDKLVATVAEPTMSDKRSHFVFDSEELEDISKKFILMKSNEISENCLFSYEF